MPVKQVGKRWHVVNAAGETIEGFAKKDEALKLDRELAKRAKAAPAPAPEGPAPAEPAQS
jgi:hypothetical protein